MLALVPVNPGGLQGSDELPPAAAVLINADPRSGVGDRDACSCSFGGGSRKTVRQRASSHLLEQAYWRSRGGSKATRTSQPEKQGYLRRFFNKVKPSVQSVSSRHKNT